jgi:alcohol dehydrogenase
MGFLYQTNGQLRWPLRLLLSHRFFPRATDDPTETMSTCVYESHGDASRLGMARIPKPVCVSGQVLVRVVGAGVNPVDLKMRANPIPSEYFPKPKIPGTDISGIVVSAPPGSSFAAGDRVIAMMPLLGAKWGACAEFAAVDERLVARAPPNVPLLHAAALPMVALTVMEALEPVARALGETRDARILVQAGSGGVGSFAVQYCARVLGMSVTATCSGPNVELVRSLGAERVIDYQREAFEQVLEPSSLDVVLDVLSYACEERTLKAKLIRPGGHYVKIASSPWETSAADADPLGLGIPEARLDRLLGGFLKARVSGCAGGVRRHLVFVHPSGAVLAQAAGAVERGEVRPVIDKVFPLERMREAHECVQTGRTRGKVVIEVADEATVLAELGVRSASGPGDADAPASQ